MLYLWDVVYYANKIPGRGLIINKASKASGKWFWKHYELARDKFWNLWQAGFYLTEGATEVKRLTLEGWHVGSDRSNARPKRSSTYMKAVEKYVQG